MEEKNKCPKVILIFSGKRKSGKDYITDALLSRLESADKYTAVVRLSAPIKSHWSAESGLDLEKLMSSGAYKEDHRRAMVEWSENIRNKDYGYFCRAALETIPSVKDKKVWIISDARRKTDLKWFGENFPSEVIKTVRVTTSDGLRGERGWIFKKGIDDAETECDLDSYEGWDIVFKNNENEAEFERQMNQLVDLCRT